MNDYILNQRLSNETWVNKVNTLICRNTQFPFTSVTNFEGTIFETVVVLKKVKSPTVHVAHHNLAHYVIRPLFLGLTLL